jgi:hypothetical protein
VILKSLRRARKGVDGARGSSLGCLRDVPTPQETEPGLEGPAVQVVWGA